MASKQKSEVNVGFMSDKDFSDKLYVTSTTSNWNKGRVHSLPISFLVVTMVIYNTELFLN